jgi:hypothetical protein
VSRTTLTSEQARLLCDAWRWSASIDSFRTLLSISSYDARIIPRIVQAAIVLGHLDARHPRADGRGLLKRLRTMEPLDLAALHRQVAAALADPRFEDDTDAALRAAGLIE